LITDKAIEALARILANEALFNADLDGCGWDAETDSSDHFMPTARKKARRYLEAAAPIIAAQAWDEGWQKAHATDDPPMVGIFLNPYRPAS